MGISIRTFIDPEHPNRVGLIGAVPDLEAVREVMESEVVADAMSTDGVRPETLVMPFEV